MWGLKAITRAINLGNSRVMTQEERELLLIDLSARLSYRTMVKCITDYHHEFDEELSVIHIMNFYQFEVKPYLRPMSSMTEEEKREYFSFIGGKRPFDGDFSAYPIEYTFVYEHDINSYIYWLNKHHFDYRGLIEKGLALEATEGMYSIKDK